jgi:hypothetical protein
MCENSERCYVRFRIRSGTAIEVETSADFKTGDTDSKMKEILRVALQSISDEKIEEIEAVRLIKKIEGQTMKDTELFFSPPELMEFKRAAI